MGAHTTKIGVPPFLNTKPLVAAIEGFRIVEHPPSELLSLTLDGAVDMALLPSADIFGNPGLTVLKGTCISSRGEVGSVAVFSKKPMEKIESVAVDSYSSSSAAMVRLCLEGFCGAKPRYEKRMCGAGFFADVDAGLVIGNAGLTLRSRPPEGFPLVFDLGEVWTRHTGLPFVYAVFAAREGFDPGPAALALETSRDKGMTMLENIARMESGALGLGEDVCRDYLENKIRYRLGPEEINGLLEFGRLLNPDSEPVVNFHGEVAA